MSEQTNYDLSVSGETSERKAPAYGYQPRFPQTYRPKIGLIGCGGITKQHLTAYKTHGLDIVALCDIHSRAAETRAREFFPQAAIYSDAKDLLAREDIEVVDIALHPAERVDVIEQALHAGKHVLSQKPFVLDLDVGYRLCERAKAKGLKLAVNQNGRWAPYVRYAQLALRDGLIGVPKTVSVHIAWDHTWVVGTPFDKIHHLLLYDFAIHWIDMVCCFMDETPHSASTCLVRSPTQTPAPPLLATAHLAFKQGLASLTFDGSAALGQEESIVITGTQGRIRARGRPLQAHDIQIETSAGVAKPALLGSWMPDGFAGTMGELLCAIEEDREPENSGLSAMRSLEAAFAIIESADTGRVVRVGDARSLGASCRVSP